MDVDCQFTCDACGQLVTVPEDLIGQTVKCPNPMCGYRLKVPADTVPIQTSSESTNGNDIEFPCPFCRHLLVVDKRGIGKLVACPECCKSITIPTPITLAAPILAPPPMPPSQMTAASATPARVTSAVNLGAYSPEKAADQNDAQASAFRNVDESRNAKPDWLFRTRKCLAWVIVLFVIGIMLAAVTACILHFWPKLSELLKDTKPHPALNSTATKSPPAPVEDAAQRDARILDEYTKAALKGDAQSQNILGFLYHKTRNYSEAAKWYRKAANQGDPNGQTNLGTLYANGQGVVKNLTAAYGWHLLAGDAGKFNADHILPLLTPSQVQEARNWAKAWKPVVERPAEEGHSGKDSAEAILPKEQARDNVATPGGPAAGSGTQKASSDKAQDAVAREQEQAAALKREELTRLIADAEQAERDGDFGAAQNSYEHAVENAATDVERMKMRENVKRVCLHIALEKKKAVFKDLMERGQEAETKEDWQGAKAIYLEALAAAPDEKLAAQVRMCGSRIVARINERAKQNPPVNQTVMLGLVSRRVVEARRPWSAALHDSAGKVLGSLSITSNNQDPFESVTIMFKGAEKNSSVCDFNSTDSVGTTKVAEVDGMTLSCRLTDISIGRNGSNGLFIRTISVRVTATRIGG